MLNVATVRSLLARLAPGPVRDGSLARELGVHQAVIQAALEGLKLTSVLIDGQASSSGEGHTWRLYGDLDHPRHDAPPPDGFRVIVFTDGGAAVLLMSAPGVTKGGSA